jgi:hypothetical protein
MANTIELTLGDIQESKIVQDDITGTNRWTYDREVVFAHTDGKFYRAVWREDATEMQEGSGTGWNENVTCTEVEPVEKTVIVYETVK